MHKETPDTNQRGLRVHIMLQVILCLTGVKSDSFVTIYLSKEFLLHLFTSVLACLHFRDRNTRLQGMSISVLETAIFPFIVFGEPVLVNRF